MWTVSSPSIVLLMIEEFTWLPNVQCKFSFQPEILIHTPRPLPLHPLWLKQITLSSLVHYPLPPIPFLLQLSICQVLLTFCCCFFVLVSLPSWIRWQWPAQHFVVCFFLILRKENLLLMVGRNNVEVFLPFLKFSFFCHLCHLFFLCHEPPTFSCSFCTRTMSLSSSLSSLQLVQPSLLEYQWLFVWHYKIIIIIIILRRMCNYGLSSFTLVLILLLLFF